MLKWLGRFISTGIYGYPIAEAAKITIDAVCSFLAKGSRLQKVIFCCYSPTDSVVYEKLLHGKQVKYIKGADVFLHCACQNFKPNKYVPFVFVRKNNAESFVAVVSNYDSLSALRCV